MMNDAFCVEKAYREFLILPRGAHGDRKIAAVDAYLQRLLDGQQVLRDADYLTADPAVSARVPELKPEEGHFRVRFFPPEAIEAGTPKWKRIFDELFG